MLNAFKLREITGRAPPLMRLAFLCKNWLYHELMQSLPYARELFQDPVLFERLSLNQIIQIIGKHPLLASKIKNPNIRAKLTDDQLFTLDDSLESTAPTAVNDHAFEAQLNTVRTIPITRDGLQTTSRNQCINNLVQLAHTNYEYSLRLVQDNVLSEQLDADNLAALGKNHPRITTYILNTPHLSQKLTGYHLVTLGRNHREIVMTILRTPHLMTKLTGANIARLCSLHLEAAWYVLSNDRLCAKFETGSDWATLGETHLDIAEEIIQNQHLWPLLDNDNLVAISIKHIAIAKYILDKPELLNKLDGERLASIGLYHSGIASRIVKTTALFNKLDNNDIETLCQNHSFIASFVLQSPTLHKTLSSHNLANFAQNHHENAKLILQAPELYKRLSVEDLAKITVCSIDAARLVAHTPELFNKVISLDAAIDSRISLGVYRVLVQGPLSEKISDELKQKLEKNIILGELIFSDLNSMPGDDLEVTEKMKGLTC